MRVGLNLTFLTGGGGGAARYARELVRGLEGLGAGSDLTIFIGADAPDDVRRDAPSAEWVRLPVRVANKMHLPAQLAALPLLSARRRLDLIHSPANIGPFVSFGVRRVVTLLDVIWLHQRENWEGGAAARGFAFLSRRAAANAHRVLTISDSARDDLVASLPLPRQKVDVTPLGVRVDPGAVATPQRELRARLELGESPVILCVAQKRPYKNQASLVRALPELEGHILVLPGFETPYEHELRDLARKLGVLDRVRFPTWVSEADLEGLYRLAAVFALPSLIEGFGLPVLEAMARGVPVVCSDRPALPEIAGDAALLFDPERQDDVTAALRRVTHDHGFAASLADRGLARARRFTWERTARATLDSYERAVGQRV